ncbi:MAG: type 1 glutamine amidotransferase [Rubrobacteridae bacterium]|nr:type 1 glutamine amidotransferase [Rubrobacteridae bacterium]
MEPTILVLENDDEIKDQNLSKAIIELIGAKARCEVFEPNSGFKRALPRSTKGIIVGGGLPSVNDRKDWIDDEVALIRQAVSLKLPIFGICFGHQLIGKAFGGKVVRHERKVGFAHIVKVADSPIFDGLPERWRSPVYHQDRLEIVPEGLKLIATSDYCAVQAMSHRYLPIYSTQFHPEIHFGINERFADPVAEWDEKSSFEKTPNMRIMNNFVELCLRSQSFYKPNLGS